MGGHDQGRGAVGPATRELARADAFRFIAHYNHHRRHSSMDYLTPEQADQRYRHIELPLAA